MLCVCHGNKCAVISDSRRSLKIADLDENFAKCLKTMVGRVQVYLNDLTNNELYLNSYTSPIFQHFFFSCFFFFLFPFCSFKMATLFRQFSDRLEEIFSPPSPMPVVTRFRGARVSLFYLCTLFYWPRLEKAGSYVHRNREQNPDRSETVLNTE